jgi:hypothetical protein
MESKRLKNAFPQQARHLLIMCFHFLHALYFFYGEAFHCSQDLRVSILKDHLWLLNFSNYNTFGSLSPSSHQMRYNTFLGSVNAKTQKMRRQRGKVWKVVIMSGNHAMNLQGDPQ